MIYIQLFSKGKPLRLLTFTVLRCKENVRLSLIAATKRTHSHHHTFLVRFICVVLIRSSVAVCDAMIRDASEE